MIVTKISITISERRHSGERLCGFADVVFDDCFVVREIKIISGDNNTFVSMPNKKKQESCQVCNGKNRIDAHFCNHCAVRLPPAAEGRLKYEDLAFPLTSEFRQYLTREILQAYRRRLIAAAREKSAESCVKTVA